MQYLVGLIMGIGLMVVIRIKMDRKGKLEDKIECFKLEKDENGKKK